MGEVRILFASRLLREKGVEELLAAFEWVRESVPAARLWIAGDRYPANPTCLSEAEVAALGRRPGVEVLGHVDDMPALLDQVDLVALPSWREGTPKILLEAAACGLPIVATDIPGCRGVVADGDSGFLVPVRDPRALGQALGTLCADGELRARMGARGRQIILDGFTTETVVRRTLEVYDSLWGGAG